MDNFGAWNSKTRPFGSLRVLPVAGNDRSQSAAAHGDDDFESVTVTKHLLAMPAAWHDLAVTLERHALAGEVEMVKQLPTVKRLFEAASFAVDGERNQCDIQASRPKFLQLARALARLSTLLSSANDGNYPGRRAVTLCYHIDSAIVIRCFEWDISI
jgi:hypothetical protein